MNKRDKFLKSQKVLRLATVGKNKTPHIAPVWYRYVGKIFGVMGQGEANLILDKSKVKTIAKKILLQYFKTLKNKSAKELLDDTDCIIEIIPEKYSIWNY